MITGDRKISYHAIRRYRPRRIMRRHYISCLSVAPASAYGFPHGALGAACFSRRCKQAISLLYRAKDKFSISCAAMRSRAFRCCTFRLHWQKFTASQKHRPHRDGISALATSPLYTAEDESPVPAPPARSASNTPQYMNITLFLIKNDNASEA